MPTTELQELQSITAALKADRDMMPVCSAGYKELSELVAQSAAKERQYLRMLRVSNSVPKGQTNV